MPPDRTPRVLPGLDSLDNEEAPPGLHEPEPARLAHKRRVAGGVGELLLELSLLGPEGLDLAGALNERLARTHVGVKRPVVEQTDKAKRRDAEPAANEHTAPRPTL